MLYYETVQGGLISKAGELIDIKVSRNSMDRALRIMDSLIKALEKRSYLVTISLKEARSRVYVTRTSVLGESVVFRLKESYTQKKHEPVQNSKKKTESISASYPAYDYFATGVLSLCIEEFLGGVKLVWGDRKKQKLEEVLNDFVIGLVRAAVSKRERRLERQREERDRIDREMRWLKQEEIRKKEKVKLDALLEEADNWSKSKLIREYVKAVAEAAIKRYGKIEAGSELDLWITWANGRADYLDPLVNTQS